MDKLVLKVGGMTCGGCAAGVRRALSAVEGVSAVIVSLEKGEATVEGKLDGGVPDKLRAAVVEAGFDVG